MDGLVDNVASRVLSIRRSISHEPYQVYPHSLEADSDITTRPVGGHLVNAVAQADAINECGVWVSCVFG